jgi:hypothetical protein
MREHVPAQRPPARPPAAAVPAPTGLAARVGNRAMARAVARMESKEAVEALAASLAPGVLGAEQRVADTLTAFRHDDAGFEQVGKDYERQVKAPLPPLARDPGQA